MFLQRMKPIIRRSITSLVISFDNYMPIFISLRLANYSINSEKHTKFKRFNIQDCAQMYTNRTKVFGHYIISQQLVQN